MSARGVIDVLLPQLSEAMTDGIVLAWLKAEGDAVAIGDPLVEIETDKSTVVHAAEVAGALRIIVPEGQVAAVGAVIARIDSSLVAGGEVDTSSTRTIPAPIMQATAPIPPPPAPVVQAAAADRSARLAASPLARRLAARHGVDVATLDGNGPGGMVLRADVMRAARLPGAPSAAVGRLGEVTVVETSRIQRIVAERMTESRATIPDFTMRVDVDMDEAVALRGRLREATGDGPSPSLNDMVITAVGRALRAVPKANAAIREGLMERYSRVNVGFAVATEDALLVPVVVDADARSLGEIAREARRLASAVRDGSIAPTDLEGGTFTVSNLGMYGLRSFTAVIVPPQAAILAVGAVREEPVVRDGRVRIGHVMSLTLAGDHRVLNGVDGAELLVAIAAGLERPLRLLV